MHSFKLNDKVCHIEMGFNDSFDVVGLREDTVELYGDWSGGTNPYPGTQKDWVHISKVVPYDETKVITYDKKGNPQTHEDRLKLKERNHLDSKADKDEVLIYVKHNSGDDEGKFSRCYFPLPRAIEIRDQLSESIAQAQKYASTLSTPV